MLPGPELRDLEPVASLPARLQPLRASGLVLLLLARLLGPLLALLPVLLQVLRAPEPVAPLLSLRAAQPGLPPALWAPQLQPLEPVDQCQPRS